MEKALDYNLSTPEPISTKIIPEVIKLVEKAALEDITQTTKGHALAPELIKLVFTGSRQEWQYNWKRINIAAVEAAYRLSNKRFSNIHIASTVTEIRVDFNEVRENGRMAISCSCHGGSGKSAVIDSSKTRANTADGSVDGESSFFNNLEDLHLMGLKFKYDDKYTILTILWQFHGKAKQDSQETLRLSITGGDKEAVFCRNEGKTYSILGVQDRFTLCYVGESSNDIKDTDIIQVGRKIRKPQRDSSVDWLEGKYDYSLNQWTYRICRDATIDGDINFSSETWYPLEKPQMITIDGISIRLESIGRLSHKRNLFNIFR